MSYTKTTWADGDIITAEKLNNIENGIYNNDGLVVNVIENNGDYETDTTWQQIHDAMISGKTVIIYWEEDSGEIKNWSSRFVLTHDTIENKYGLTITSSQVFETSNPNTVLSHISPE